MRKIWLRFASASLVILTGVVALWAQSLPVTYDRLLHADKEPGNWLMYSHTYNGWRFSQLNQINTQNVKNLQVKWLFQGRHDQKFETTPLVVDGIMYLTRPENDVFAVSPRWRISTSSSCRAHTSRYGRVPRSRSCQVFTG